MDKKYILTEEAKDIVLSDGLSKRLYRIMAFRDFGSVKGGQLGGFVENESNLSHEGECFIFDDAVVCENATVEKNFIFIEITEVQLNAEIKVVFEYQI